MTTCPDCDGTRRGTVPWSQEDDADLCEPPPCLECAGTGQAVQS